MAGDYDNMTATDPLESSPDSTAIVTEANQTSEDAAGKVNSTFEDANVAEEINPTSDDVDVAAPLLNEHDEAGAGTHQTAEPNGLSFFASNEFALAVASFVEMTDSFVHAVPVPVLPSLFAKYDVNEWHLAPLHGSYGAGHLVGCVMGFFMTRHLGLRLTMLIGAAILMVATAAPLVGLLQSDKAVFLVTMYVNRFIGGAGSSINSMSAFLLIVVHYDDDRGKAMGICSACSTAGGLAGMLAAGLLNDYAEAWAGFLTAFGLVIIDFVVRALLADNPKHYEQSSLDENDTFQLSRFRGPVCIALVAFLIQQTVSQTLWPVVPSYCRDVFHSASSQISLVLLVPKVSQLCISPVAGYLYDRINQRHWKIVLWCLLLILYAAMLVLSAYVSNLRMLYVTMAAIGLAGGALWPVTMTVVSQLCDSYSVRKTTYSAWSYTVFGLALLIGPAVGVALYMQGIAVLQWSNAGAIVLASLLVARMGWLDQHTEGKLL